MFKKIIVVCVLGRVLPSIDTTNDKIQVIKNVVFSVLIREQQRYYNNVYLAEVQG